MNILELEAEHGWLLESGLFLAIFTAVYVLLKSVSRKTFRWVFPIANSILLTVFTVGCSGQFPLLLGEQAVLFSGLHHFHSQLHQNQSINALLGDNRLLLVDVSHDLALIPDSSINATWRANQLITDRQKLAQFLTSLNTTEDSARDFVSMVVCDLTFGDFSTDRTQDKALQDALNALNSEGKLLIAKSDLAQSRSIRGNLSIDTDAMAGGSVDIRKYYEGKFFRYKLYEQNPDSLPSLAYVLYDSIQHLTPIPHQSCPPKLRKKPSGFVLSDTFVPDFWIDNKDVSRETEAGSEEPHPMWHSLFKLINPEPEENLQEAAGQLRDSFYYLGQVTDTDTSEFSGRRAFQDQLRDNYNRCKRNIVFIGLFEDPERDMHHTLVGPMHGSVLLLNMFMNLLAGSHLIGYGYLLYLLVGFWGIGYLLIQEVHPINEHIPSKGKGPWIVVWDSIREIGYRVRQYMVEKRAYLLAFVVLLGAIAFFNHLINLIIIGVYIATVTEVFEKLYHDKPKHAKVHKRAHKGPADNTHP
ncbi:hypothetical protein GCM10028805_07870 [Spirosoma harenae]